MNLSQEELLSQLRQMDEYEFEELVADVWEQQGWETTVTTGSSDRGIDVIARKSRPFSQKQLIQAKRYSAGNKIGSPDIQQYSSLRQQEDNVDAVVVVTTSSFSRQAQQTANDLNVKLIGGEDLADMISKLNTQSFLSNYLEENKTKSSQNQSQSIERSAKTSKTNGTSSPNEASSSANTSKAKSTSSTNHDLSADSTNIYKIEGSTNEFGQTCPICGSENRLRKATTVTDDSIITCLDCDTQWEEVGLIFTKWENRQDGTRKSASKWKKMTPD